MFTKILARERSSRAYMKFEHQISEGTYHTQGLRQKNSIIFIVQRYIFSENCQNGHYALIGRPLRRDTIASLDRFRPMGARQN